MSQVLREGGGEVREGRESIKRRVASTPKLDSRVITSVLLMERTLPSTSDTLLRESPSKRS